MITDRIGLHSVLLPLLIIYMKKLLGSDWLTTVQFFLNTVQKRGNWMQKKVMKQAFWLVNEQRSSQIANQICCFQIKRVPWMAQLWRNFFLDCVIIKITWGLARAQNWEESSEFVKFKTSFTQIFSCILLIGNHTAFLVQFGINLHLRVFQKAKLQINSKLNPKPYDYLYKLHSTQFNYHYV